MAMNEVTAVSQIDKAYKALGAQKGAKGARAVDVCGMYAKIKPSLPSLLFIVGMIPIYGSKIKAILQVVFQAADAACG